MLALQRREHRGETLAASMLGSLPPRRGDDQDRTGHALASATAARRAAAGAPSCVRTLGGDPRGIGANPMLTSFTPPEPWSSSTWCTAREGANRKAA